MNTLGPVGKPQKKFFPKWLGHLEGGGLNSCATKEKRNSFCCFPYSASIDDAPHPEDGLASETVRLPLMVG